ncbi:MAG: GNAT family N-acetyltransferase [Gemmatimonadaceae bacterium]
MTYVIETQRLGLRPLTPDDLDFVALMLADAHVMRFYPHRYTREESSEWIERQVGRYARDGHGLWLVEERGSGVAIGQVGLCMQMVDGDPIPEVGYLLHHKWWGKGMATEAASSVRDWAFDEREYPRVVSLIRRVNSASRRVAMRVGMTWWRGVTHAGLPHDVYGMERPTPSDATDDFRAR